MDSSAKVVVTELNVNAVFRSGSPEERLLLNALNV
jgi:hypothetical protein